MQVNPIAIGAPGSASNPAGAGGAYSVPQTRIWWGWLCALPLSKNLTPDNNNNNNNK